MYIMSFSLILLRISFFPITDARGAHRPVSHTEVGLGRLSKISKLGYWRTLNKI